MLDASPRPAGLWRYLKEAFVFRWNLLFFLGGAAAAALSPVPDVLLPLVAAAELTYLGGLTAVPRFRAAIDAKAHAERTGPLVEPGAAPRETLSDLLSGLDPTSRTRFDRLRARCLDMQRLAHGVRGQTGDAARTDEIREPALDRLLWAFLRLLYSRNALDRFLSTTDEGAIQKSLADLRARQAQAVERGDERIARAVADSVATAELRLDNFRKTAANAEYVAVELDRIEGKIQAIAETAVSHQDAASISSQVDAVAESMAHTEEAIREIHQITGLSDEMAETPAILSAELEPAGSGRGRGRGRA